MHPRRSVLITGASGGIGAELARLFAAGGYDLWLTGRNRDALKGMTTQLGARYGVSVRSVQADLSEPGEAERLWGEVTRHAEVDVLVNNAGAGLYGDVAALDGAAMKRMLELNIVSLAGLTRLALPGMLQRGWGRILNVASITAFQPGGPGMAAYYASKAFVLSFSRGLARELAGTGVSVTALCPGPTRTGFEDSAGMGRTLLFRWFSGVDARSVAAAGYRGLERKRTVVVPGFWNKLMAVTGTLSPSRVALEVNRVLLR